MTTLRCERVGGNVVGAGSKTPCRGKVKIFRFYNYEYSKHGEPFALCEEHRREQPIPQECHLDELEVAK